MRCEAANDKNFIDIVRRLAPISRHRILPTVGMARSVIYNSATSADAGRQCRRGVVPDSNLEACDGSHQRMVSRHVVHDRLCRGGDRHRGAHARSVMGAGRSEEHTSELQSLMRISYAVFCLKKKTIKKRSHNNTI